MEKRIKDSRDVGAIDPRIEGGHYELIGPGEEIILPGDWEEVIEPGWVIAIRMLPMPEPEALLPRIPPNPKSKATRNKSKPVRFGLRVGG
jgi:hypothetical protein